MELEAAARIIQAECLATRARQTARLISRIYDELLRPTGLQVSQFTMLVGAARFGERGAAIGALAEKLVMDRTTLTRNLRPLEKGGYLRVARSPTDARVKVILLTKKGERALEQGLPVWQRAQALVRDKLGAQRTARLQAELDAVLKALDVQGQG
jgi:DNA-binding MarR family transcriptional regulator